MHAQELFNLQCCGCACCSAKVAWNTKCRPILEAAGMDLQPIETLCSKHASEVAQTLDIKAVDAIVCVGGDGTMSEIVQVNKIEPPPSL